MHLWRAPGEQKVSIPSLEGDAKALEKVSNGNRVLSMIPSRHHAGHFPKMIDRSVIPSSKGLDRKRDKSDVIVSTVLGIEVHLAVPGHAKGVASSDGGMMLMGLL